ncbi:hypothetical protein TRP8649_00021 [Pelagimonas phthalicica]|uniref:Probable branched-chain-amino-acid aminotransferase n=1 Tax=Pelagimonas phthalicica TaxID=1037362 RepID=A0A238J5R6_9RHOB|nr:aminotransferase class IV family protein [Pelagimonas phthalicica]TDS95528.1 4-amino-4-deoxychorismate lyase [Pelagimonas phthalicica]SMX25949.1 hypothetical protein TRP8649_00021 [Pelagimonas phthalicica]
MESPLCPAEPEFRLIETFAVYPDRETPLLARHLDRMARSARGLGIPMEIAQIRADIESLNPSEPLRCRLTLSARGQPELTTSPLPPTPSVWRVAIADQRLDSAEPWLRHKSTRRALYESARAALPDGIDELLFLNERDELCEGTITNLFITTQAGERLTPPLSSGLLPGVLRAHLLDLGQYQTRALTLAELTSASSFHMGNAMRGLIPATFVEIP